MSRQIGKIQAIEQKHKNFCEEVGWEPSYPFKNKEGELCSRCKTCGKVFKFGDN